MRDNKFKVGDLIKAKNIKSPLGREDRVPVSFGIVDSSVESGILAIITDIPSSGRLEALIYLDEGYRKGKFSSFNRLWEKAYK
tara:strand:- start:42 stop:290 length:249 start_codon:yes stop_codon:yes gene_type:complete